MIEVIAYKWADTLIPADLSKPHHQEEGVPLIRADVTRRRLQAMVHACPHLTPEQVHWLDTEIRNLL